MKKRSNLSLISIRLDEETIKKLKKVCKKEQRTRTNYLRMIIENNLKRKK